MNKAATASRKDIRMGCNRLMKRATAFVLFTIDSAGRLNLGGDMGDLRTKRDKFSESFVELADVVQERLGQIVKMRRAWQKQEEQDRLVQSVKDLRSKNLQEEAGD